jgi:hypothetical protein
MRHGYNKHKFQLCCRQNCGAQSVKSEHIGLVKHLLGLIKTCNSFRPQNVLTKQQCYTVRERERENLTLSMWLWYTVATYYHVLHHETTNRWLVQLAADVCSRARENIVTVSRNSQTNEGLCAKECSSESRRPLSFHTRFVRYKLF